MTWLDLLFAHWPVSVDALRPLIPPRLTIDTHEERAWLGIVPFRMKGVRPRILPAVPWVSNFPELNVRTYVRIQEKPGVWFFSLDVTNPLAVMIARAYFLLPYYRARMSFVRDDAGVRYESERKKDGATLVARYRPKGPAYRSEPESLDAWLTDRYCLYTSDKNGRIYRGEVDHDPWPLQPAEAEFPKLDLTEPLGITLPKVRPVLHFVEKLDVVAWSLGPPVG